VRRQSPNLLVRRKRKRLKPRQWPKNRLSLSHHSQRRLTNVSLDQDGIGPNLNFLLLQAAITSRGLELAFLLFQLVVQVV
jgi:hypothetical protein